MTPDEINNLDGEAAEKLCDQLGLDTSGDDDTLRDRLRVYYTPCLVRAQCKANISNTQQPSLTTIPWPPIGLTPAQLSEYAGLEGDAMTRDGLVIYKQEGVGLVVSAAEHNYKLSEWQAERAQLERRLNAALDIICSEWGYTRKRALDWLDNPNS